MNEEMREKVIKAMECCAVGAECDHCWYSKMNKTGHEGCYQMHADVLDLLKAQEPRVMTLEEVIQHYSLPPVFVDDFNTQEDYYEDIRPLYFEFPYQEEDPCIVHWRGHDQVVQYLDMWKPTYNKKWRCWTAKPTEEQRKEVKWDE